MARVTLTFLFFCCSFAFPSAETVKCIPVTATFFVIGNDITINWTNKKGGESDCNDSIIMAEHSFQITYFYSNGNAATLSMPYSCTSYIIGIQAYSVDGATGPLIYLNATTDIPSTINLNSLSIKATETYIIAEWAPQEATKKCIDGYQIVLSFTNHVSPLDAELLSHMTMFHKQTTTSYNILPLDECVNNTISISVAPYFHGSLGEWIRDTYTCY